MWHVYQEISTINYTTERHLHTHPASFLNPSTQTPLNMWIIDWCTYVTNPPRRPAGSGAIRVRDGRRRLTMNRCGQFGTSWRAWGWRTSTRYASPSDAAEGAGEGADAGQKLLFLGLDNAGKTTVGHWSRSRLCGRLADADAAVAHAEGTPPLRGLDIPSHGVEAWAKLAAARRTTECMFRRPRPPAYSDGMADLSSSAVLQPTLHPSAPAPASRLATACPAATDTSQHRRSSASGTAGSRRLIWEVRASGGATRRTSAAPGG